MSTAESSDKQSGGDSAAPEHPFSLTGKTALVTGGGSGIGLAVARAFVQAGARVVLVGRRAALIEEGARSIGHGSIAIVHDVTHTEETPAVVEQVESRVGPVDILVNNAGVHLKKSAVETTSEEFHNMFGTHIVGAHALTRAVVPGMIKRGGGTILFIASMASLFGIPMVVAYSAAKSAMVGMVRTLATELSPNGIRVNAIAPGWIETDMSSKAFQGDPERIKNILRRTPMHRLGTVKDVGHAAVYLASPAAAFVTGIVLPVDGGVSIGF
jgi:gluconate 5-dehydrogenase